MVFFTRKYSSSTHYTIWHSPFTTFGSTDSYLFVPQWTRVVCEPLWREHRCGDISDECVWQSRQLDAWRRDRWWRRTRRIRILKRSGGAAIAMSQLKGQFTGRPSRPVAGPSVRSSNRPSDTWHAYKPTANGQPNVPLLSPPPTVPARSTWSFFVSRSPSPSPSSFGAPRIYIAWIMDARVPPPPPPQRTVFASPSGDNDTASPRRPTLHRCVLLRPKRAMEARKVLPADAGYGIVFRCMHGQGSHIWIDKLTLTEERRGSWGVAFYQSSSMMTKMSASLPVTVQRAILLLHWRTRRSVAVLTVSNHVCLSKAMCRKAVCNP